MKHRIAMTGMIALALIVATGASNAYEHSFEAPAKPAANSPAAAKAGQAGKPKAKAAAVKLVDINSAGKAELKTLTGIDDARADKIIAGRPYLSKAFLVTRNIIPVGVYETIKRQIIAKQK